MDKLINGHYIVLPKTTVKTKTSYFYYKSKLTSQDMIDYIQMLEQEIFELKQDHSQITAGSDNKGGWRKNCKLL